MNHFVISWSKEIFNTSRARLCGLRRLMSCSRCIWSIYGRIRCSFDASYRSTIVILSFTHLKYVLYMYRYWLIPIEKCFKHAVQCFLCIVLHRGSEGIYSFLFFGNARYRHTHMNQKERFIEKCFKVWWLIRDMKVYQYLILFSEYSLPSYPYKPPTN